MTTATSPLEAHREKILAFLRDGEAYRFLTTIDGYLEAAADDHYVRLMAVREYLSLGLLAAAQELLDVERVDLILPPELTTLHEQIQSLPNAAIPWTPLTDTLERNLAAIEARTSEAETIRRSWTAARHEFRLFRDRHGVHQVRRRTGQRWRWFPYLGHHRAVDDARPLPEGIGRHMPGPFLFEGLGLGRFFERVYQATTNTFLGYSCAIFVVVEDAAEFAVALHLNDWREILSDPRVLLFVGPSALARLREAWDSDTDLPFPSQAIGLGNANRATPVVVEAADARETKAMRSFAELEKRYAPRTVEYWARRFHDALHGGPPLRILAAVSTHTTFLQHSMRDAKRALESLGHPCTVLSERNNHTVTGPLTFHQAIRDLDPDVFFVLDHLRPEFANLIPANLPILTWDQDQLPHVMTSVNLRQIARHDYLVGCSKSHCLDHGCDPRQLLHARVATCPEQFDGPPLTDDERARYACDVAYVSHASQTPRSFHEEEREAYDHPRIRDLLDVMFTELPLWLAKYRVVDGLVMSAVLADGCKKVGITGLDADVEQRLRGWYLWRLGDRIFRHEALEWVARWAKRTGRSFRIYGRGWDAHPTLSGFAAGPVENGRELLCVHRATRINLQLMPAGFIHQRSLDGMAAGGFFLTRLCPHDRKGRALRKLDAAVRNLGLGTSAALLESGDVELRQLMESYLGDWLRHMDRRKFDFLRHVRLNAELLHPDEVFADFPDILFDSAEDFTRIAERFLPDEPRRRAVADRMRRVVLERFSYRTTMDQFLGAMAGYLKTLAAEPPLATKPYPPNRR